MVDQRVSMPTPESWKRVGEILDNTAWHNLLTSEEIYKLLQTGDHGVTIQVDSHPVPATSGSETALKLIEGK